ncbi:MAG: hypothetical protein WD554_02840 [Flavobacteriaceae bacterium]
MDRANKRLKLNFIVKYTFLSFVVIKIWRFKESLIQEGLMDKLFDLILSFIESKGLLLKKGTYVDTSIIEPTTKPLSKERREELEKVPSNKIDSNADSTQKRGKKYFGYKRTHRNRHR